MRTLDVWDSHLAIAGAELLAARLALVAGPGAVRRRGVHPGQRQPGAGGDRLPGEPDRARAIGAAGERGSDRPPDRQRLAERLLAAMGGLRKTELERGISLVGPHRDDLVLTLGPMPAKGYASHGESWSFALGAAAGVVRAAAVRPG